MNHSTESTHIRLTQLLVALFIATLMTSCGGSDGDGSNPDTTAPQVNTPDSEGHLAELLETNAGYASRPQIAVDAEGNALAVWTQNDGDGPSDSIWANHYTSGAGWGTAELIETTAKYAHSPKIAVDTAGNALAVWIQSDGTDMRIWSNRYTSGIGWGTAELIETGASNVEAPQIAIDAAGNALAVWTQSPFSIWSNRYTSGAGWGTAELVETRTGSASQAQIAVDDAGNALAVWTQYDGTANSIWSNRYTSGPGWDVAVRIETGTENAKRPQITVSATGNALVVWAQSDGTTDSIWANRYTNGIGWSTAELIETLDRNAENPQIAVDAEGNALAVWQQREGTVSSLRDEDIWSNRYTSGIGWGTAELIETRDGPAENPQIAFDAAGNALAVWSQFVGAFSDDVWSSRYTSGSGWGTAELVAAGTNEGGAYNPQISINAAGNTFAVWQQWDGSEYSILSSNQFD